MSRPESYRHKHPYPCTCALGHVYRFVEPIVLLLLKQKGRSCGYDLSSNVCEYAFTDAEIERAVLYRTLRRLEAKGYVSSDWETDRGGPARRIYALTRLGERHLREWAQVLARVAASMGGFVHVVESLFPRSGQRAGRQEIPARIAVRLAKGGADE